MSRSICLLLSFIAIFNYGPLHGEETGADSKIIEEQKVLKELEKDLSSLLSTFDESTVKTHADLREHYRKLMKVIDKHAGKLRPKNGSQQYATSDNSFVINFGASGSAGKNGNEAKAEDNYAKLVVAVGGNGGTNGKLSQSGQGGGAYAKAPAGVAIALGGQGGYATGGGGGAGADGQDGSIGIGGDGGPGNNQGARGGDGGSSGFRFPYALAKSFQTE